MLTATYQLQKSLLLLPTGLGFLWMDIWTMCLLAASAFTVLTTWVSMIPLVHGCNIIQCWHLDNVSTGSICLHCSYHMSINDSSCSWLQYYPVLTFLMTGNLHADYERVGGLLGFPACSSTQWGRIVKRLEEFVSDLAEWSCSQVRKEIMERGW